MAENTEVVLLYKNIPWAYFDLNCEKKEWFFFATLCNRFKVLHNIIIDIVRKFLLNIIKYKMLFSSFYDESFYSTPLKTQS